jgi:hypothetical protein
LTAMVTPRRGGFVQSKGGGPALYRESFVATLRRTVAIALVLTTIFSLIYPRQESFWLFWLRAFPAIFWFPFGGHYVELAYLNLLRIRRPWVHRHRIVGRLLCWFIGGLPLGLGCWWTWIAVGAKPDFTLPFWWGMPFFVVAEFIVHAFLSLQGLPSFWNGRE